MLRLREKLGPFLWQLPPYLQFDEERFKAFAELLPRDSRELARLAKGYSAQLKTEPYLEVDKNRPVRHAVEFRHESFLTERFTNILRAHNIALVVADVASKFPTAEDVTADWVYVRLHGSRQLYASGYTPREIKSWAAKIEAWHAGGEPVKVRRIGDKAPRAKGGRDVFVFFDNTDVKLRAPVDARSMAQTLGIGPQSTEKEVLEELQATPTRTTKPAAARRKIAKKHK